jgi:hypothetical protein
MLVNPPPPTNYPIILLKCFPSVQYVITLLLGGALVSTRDLFLHDDKKLKKMVLVCLMASISRNACPMAASSGFYQSPRPPPSGDACSIVPADRHGHQNVQQIWCIFSFLFCSLSPWWLMGQYRASSCPMVVFTGFQCSSGHAASGDTSSITPPWPHGNWNGLQWRCIFSLLSLFCSKLLIAKDHVMVH